MTWAQLILGVYGALLAYFVMLQASYFVLLVTGVVANPRRHREARTVDLDRLAASDLTIPVSVLVPAYNEEHTIGQTVHSVLRSRFPEFEVIVVDDGSTDGTFHRLSQEFDLEPKLRDTLGSLETKPVHRTWQSRRDPRLWVVQKANGGKGDAANAGLNLAHYRYVLLTDADCVFEPDGLLRMIRPIAFDPARIVGLGATMRPLNGCEVREGRIVSTGLPRRWIERFQMVEYTSVFLSDRLGWSALNAVPVLSGGGSMWRKDALFELGGFSADSTHEDLETTLRLHRHFLEEREDYRIVYLPDTVLHTEVPHSWRGLYQQRKRWQRTLFEGVWNGRSMLFNPRHGSVGTLLLPYLTLYEAFGPFIEVFAYLLTFLLLALGLASPQFLGAFLLTAGGLVGTMRLGSLVMDLLYYQRRPAGDVVQLAGAALLEYWVYRPFTLIARLHAFVEFLRGHTGHERAERLAAVPSLTSP